MNPQITIRNALSEDVEGILVIYNEVLLTSTAIFSDKPATAEQRLAWLQSRRDQGYPVLVATMKSNVLGFASFGDFRGGPGYRHTVEATVHVSAAARRRGIATKLLDALLEEARAAGKHVMVAGVDANNHASLQLLEKSGFERSGHLREVGFKLSAGLTSSFCSARSRFLKPPSPATGSVYPVSVSS